MELGAKESSPVTFMIARLKMRSVRFRKHIFMLKQIQYNLLSERVISHGTLRLNNNLDMLNNQHMDPATEQVLVQVPSCDSLS